MIWLSRERLDHKQKIKDKYLSNYSALQGSFLANFSCRTSVRVELQYVNQDCHLARMEFTMMNLTCRPKFSNMKYIFSALLRVLVSPSLVLCQSYQHLALCRVATAQLLNEIT